MRPIPKTKSLAISAAFLAGLGLGSCLDDTGAPGAILPGRFAVAPAFVSANAGIIEIARVRIILTRPDDESVALDTVVTVEPGTDEVNLTLTVPVFSSSEAFLMTVEFITPAGEVAFRGGPVEVTATTDPTAPPVPAEVAAEYVGVGADAVEVRIICPAAPAAGASEDSAPSAVCPTNPTLLFGGTLDLTAEAFGPDGTQRPGAPIAWSALEPVRAAVADPTVGQVSGGSERGPARIVAELLTGPADTIQLIVQPQPSSLAVVSGDGQSGPVTLQLASPIVVEVKATDGLPVVEVTVDFATTDGGSFSAVSVVTDAAGQAQTNWTLGPTVGTQSTTATVSGFPSVTATITATAVVRPFGRVLILSGGNANTNGTVQAEFSVRMSGFEFDTLFANLQTPTLDFLKGFQVVLLYEDGLFSNATNVGNALFDYIQAGGNLVIGTFYWQDRSDNTIFAPPGWGTLETIDPFLGPQGSEYNADVLDANSLVAHPLTTDVDSLYVGSFHGGVAAKTGTSVVASWSDGVPLIGYRIESGGQRIVAVSTYPAYEFYGGFSGDFYQIWENALQWAAGGSVPTAISEAVAGATLDLHEMLRAIPAPDTPVRSPAGGARR